MKGKKTIKHSCRAAIAAVLLLIMLAASGLVYAAEGNDNDKSVSEPVKCKSGVLVTPIGDPDAEAPELSAKGAALYSLDMDRMVYGKNEDEKLDPYSTTKLLTCWLALDNLDPDVHRKETGSLVAVVSDCNYHFVK